MRTGFACVFAIIATVGAALPITRPAAAPIYPWCMQPSNPSGPDCYYATIEQCRAAASAVGFCYQNPAYTATQRVKPDRFGR